MKKFVCLILPSLTFVLLVIGFACRKSSNSTKSDPESDPGILTTFLNCTNSPDYGDSIIYPKWKGPNKDFTVTPKNTSVSGTYFAWPQGMVINTNTGEINVTQSETGVRYFIGFVKSGTTDTCFTPLVLGGITYVDSIYVLQNNDTLASPYYYANPNAPAVCDPSDDDDYPGNGHHGNNKCEFDDDDDKDGNGPGDEPPGNSSANGKKVRVRTNNGVINLKKTLEDGAFGSNPQNGATVDATIYYRLNDLSGKSLQKIKVQLYYFDKVSDIPLHLVSNVDINRENFFQYRIVNGKPRPPMIILTRSPQ